VINKFYETGLSFKAAEAMARLWARAFYDSEWNDEDASKVAISLDLEYCHAQLVLGMTDAYVKATKLEDKIYRTSMDSWDH